MAKYVCSDIHGCYDDFIKMLEVIKFSDNDELYICGDTIDRGKKPLEVIEYTITHKNIYLIKGNHEQMCEDCYNNGSTSLWLSNGGNTTHNKLYRKDNTYKEELMSYIRNLPYIKVVDKFILTHAGVYFPKNYEEMTIEEFLDVQEEEVCLWDRSSINNEKAFKDYTIIVGHTPVQTINNNYENPKILHRNGIIYIDCGCVFKGANGKLACLRLDDMAEFYV